ncbi:MAG: hypothetical protein MI919_40610 [Holophagales bacterium]|nr:hypothetical protein [Holophagales bacterium]
MAQKTHGANELAYDFGFDWNVPPSASYRGGVYPLQLGLSDLTQDCVRSFCNGDDNPVGSSVRFRVFDFSPRAAGGGSGSEAAPKPFSLQVLFTAGTEGEQGQTFSPVLDGSGQQQPQLLFTEWRALETTYNKVYGNVSGWLAVDPVGAEHLTATLANSGRYKLRAMLTVGIQGQAARFYRIDPEMVVGGGPNV